MPLFKAHVKLKLKGPILTKSSAPGAYGLDALCARNSDDDFIIPWTLIKGRIRDAWRELHELAPNMVPDPVTVLGPEAAAGGNRGNELGSFERHNPRLFGSDFVLLEASAVWAKKSVNRTRIAQDKDRHAAQEDMLQVMESPFIAGEEYVFTGRIEFVAADQTDADNIKRYIVKSLRWAGAFGSQTGVGFGQIGSNPDWNRQVEVAPPLTDPNPAAQSLWIRFTATQPLCITGDRVAENLFVSSETIPGGVIKGVVAAQLMRDKGKPTSLVNGDTPGASEFAKAFDQIRFSHARPHAAGAKVRPSVIPLSLARSGDSTIDMAGKDELPPGALAFQPDWKSPDWDDMRAEFGWLGDLKTELRVRTAIAPEARRAKKGNLFAYETIQPNGLEWDCEIVFPQLEHAAVASARTELLKLLADGLRGVGKTKATLNAKVLNQPLPAARTSDPSEANGTYRVTLQTPALLAGPTALKSRDPRALFAAYQAVFSALSEETLELTDFFAQQSLQGGLYLYKRFQDPGLYQPYALTNAGSVFCLKAQDADAAKIKIESWMRNGLPLPGWVKTAFARGVRDGAHWSNNPFVPENGYGEIAVNLNTNFTTIPGEVAHA